MVIFSVLIVIKAWQERTHTGSQGHIAVASIVEHVTVPTILAISNTIIALVLVQLYDTIFVSRCEIELLRSPNPSEGHVCRRDVVHERVQDDPGVNELWLQDGVAAIVHPSAHSSLQWR